MNCAVYKAGEVTLARLAYSRDRSLKMHVFTGEIKKIPGNDSPDFWRTEPNDNS